MFWIFLVIYNGEFILNLLLRFFSRDKFLEM